MNVRVFLSRQDRLSYWVSERSQRNQIQHCRVLFDSFVQRTSTTGCDLQVNVKWRKKNKHIYWSKTIRKSWLFACCVPETHKPKICVHFFRLRTILNEVSDQVGLKCFNFTLAHLLNLWFNQLAKICFLSDQNMSI